MVAVRWLALIVVSAVAGSVVVAMLENAFPSVWIGRGAGAVVAGLAGVLCYRGFVQGHQ